jgi:hypothetical protein
MLRAQRLRRKGVAAFIVGLMLVRKLVSGGA